MAETRDSRELETRIDELETSVLSPEAKKFRRSSFEVRVKDSVTGNRSVYVGLVSRLHIFYSFLDGYVVRGKIALARYDIEECTRRKISSAKGFPPKIDFVERHYEKRRLVWQVSTYHSHNYSVFMNSYGGTETSYREDLKKLADIKGITLKPRLLDEVFSPIDERITQSYKSRVRAKKV